ncbi:MAG: hypothetical protein WCG80_10045 [Spirochaetales bacterium]
MEVILIIAGATTLISFGGMIFAYLTRQQELAPKQAPVGELAQRVAALEAKLAEQDTKLLQLEESARFTAKLLEKDRT